MNIKRKEFIKLGVLAVTAGTILSFSSGSNRNVLKEIKSEPASGAEPISVAERESRVAKAQQLLVENNMAALVLDSGTSLEYFTGIEW